jgi:hypothetical protein
MSSLITRGYYKYDRIITRGYGTGWLGIIRVEVLRFLSKFTKSIEKISEFNKGC